MNVKWLRRLHITAEPTYSREETSKYTDLMPDGTAAGLHLLHGSESIITRPSGGQRLTRRVSRNQRHRLGGHGKVRRVDVSVDDGENWQEAQLQQPVLTRALTRFRCRALGRQACGGSKAAPSRPATFSRRW